MTDKILEYRTVSSPEQAQRAIEDFENMFQTRYSWGHSYGEIEEALAVCVLETESGNRYVTTTSRMKYIESREVVKVIDIGRL